MNRDPVNPDYDPLVCPHCGRVAQAHFGRPVRDRSDVYHCPRCAKWFEGTPIIRVIWGTRSLFPCPRCRRSVRREEGGELAAHESVQDLPGGGRGWLPCLPPTLDTPPA